MFSTHRDKHHALPNIQCLKTTVPYIFAQFLGRRINPGSFILSCPKRHFLKKKIDSTFFAASSQIQVI